MTQIQSIKITSLSVPSAAIAISFQLIRGILRNKVILKYSIFDFLIVSFSKQVKYYHVEDIIFYSVEISFGWPLIDYPTVCWKYLLGEVNCSTIGMDCISFVFQAFLSISLSWPFLPVWVDIYPCHLSAKWLIFQLTNMRVDRPKSKAPFSHVLKRKVQTKAACLKTQMPISCYHTLNRGVYSTQ